jgi:glycosyltransferase involved in cell wall biosynthesis
MAKALGLYRDAVWHVSSEHEAADVQRHFGSHARIIVARDCLPDIRDLKAEFSPGQKVAGRLDIVFLSRICRMKNLAGALRMLQGLQGEVRMNIYGPKEESDYWRECEAIIDTLPANIRIKYCGAVAHEEVSGIMARHHLFFLPTEGENFGFAIFEALVSGCPVLISDRTPWRNLQAAGCGWDLSLEQPGLFRETLQKCVDMDQAAFSALSEKAHLYGAKTVREDSSVAQSRALLEAALGRAAE